MFFLNLPEFMAIMFCLASPKSVLSRSSCTASTSNLDKESKVIKVGNMIFMGFPSLSRAGISILMDAPCFFLPYIHSLAILNHSSPL